jgi:hypothetical protein
MVKVAARSSHLAMAFDASKNPRRAEPPLAMVTSTRVAPFLGIDSPSSVHRKRSQPSSRVFLAAALALLHVGCRTSSARTDSPAWILIEKRPYQMLYGPDGKIDRLLYDGNGDGRADSVVLFGPDRKPRSSEMDTDLDGTMDRWESLDVGGQLVKVGRARRKPGTPDEWDVLAASGIISRREFDEDGDGKVDRVEYLSEGRVFMEELDTDHDAKPDRRIVRGPDGGPLRIEVDKDEDGNWEASRAVRR